MSTSRRDQGRIFMVFLALSMLLLGCSGSETAEPAAPAATPSSQADTTEGSTATDPEIDAPPASPAAGPSIDDDERLVDIVRLDAGEQVSDAQGNLVAIYGYRRWPASFDELPASARAVFPFFGDVADLAIAESTLVVLDVGMCSAGIDAAGFGTADFFLHVSSDEALAIDPVLDRGLLTNHPVVSPGFTFPAAAECTRGWLPVLWGHDAEPGVARYVLTTRVDTTSEPEQHLYQWAVDAVSAAPGDDVFGAGQVVTFNDGVLADSTVTVEGWAELTESDSPIEGTRLVGVSVSVCPGGEQWPQFGLGLDGWNLTAPLEEASMFTAPLDIAGPRDCAEGWLEFAVPFGAVPTAFFAGDGRDPIVGYAEWTLAGAALPAPR